MSAQEPSTGDPLPVDSITPAPQRGAWWTLIGALGTLGFILWTVWLFVLPRLSGEVVSSTAPLKISLVEETATAVSMDDPDGGQTLVGDSPVLTAEDVHTFHGYYSRTGTPMLDLNLYAGGADKLAKHIQGSQNPRFAVVIHDRLLGTFTADEVSDRRIRLDLAAVPAADAEEAFARLTQ